MTVLAIPVAPVLYAKQLRFYVNDSRERRKIGGEDSGQPFRKLSSYPVFQQPTFIRYRTSFDLKTSHTEW